ncbi:hypothetical protein BOTNAR_0526g00020 [Botryotinia narcissicola]|uniref:RNA polymerase II holoenzyme cyclin-like subunit n=1 Tax=Botryotinia narcissicola TaxID=278944 RepID=A0A4Z1HEK0_9HELO|nr:hypothetical protein BOTNAR_0526g00020 [Botryotinia narcissicola]
MTTAGQHPTAEFEFPDDHSNHTRPPSSRASTIAKKYIPPAVPSPPRLSGHHLPPEQPFRQTKHALISEMPTKVPDQWLFTEAELKATPSILEGLSPEEERIRRAKGVSFMSSIGNMLHIPMTTVSVASLYFHRFYMRRSMVLDKKGCTGIHHYEIAATALFLATKTEETIRGTKQFIFSCIKIAQKNPKLELLCFDLSATSPLKYLVGFFEEFTKVGVESAIIKELRNYTWALICDTHHSTLGLIISPRIIAITTLLFAATAKKCEIPQIEGKDWWEHLEGTEPQIVEAGLILHKFLSNSPFQITDQDQPGNTAAKYLHASSGKEERNGADTAIKSERTQDQNGNGHVHGNGTNTSEHNSQSDPESRDSQPKEKLENSQPDSKPYISTTDNSRASPTSGTDDAPLKAAANDLSSHDQTTAINDVSSNIDPDMIVSPKRKADEQIEEVPLAKRARREDTSSETIAASNDGNTLPDESQDTIQNKMDDANKDNEPDSELESKTALAATEAEAGTEDQ